MAAEVSKLAPRIAAVVPLVVLFALARTPELTSGERQQLAGRFRFTASSLPTVTRSSRTLRPVRPSLAHISAWISSVGAAVALNDLDGDGLPNDVSYVDVRSDEVVIAPVPGTPARFAPFNLLRANGCERIANAAPMGSVPIDANEDGRLDLLVYFWGRSPLLYIRDVQPLAANAYRCEELVTPREEWYSNAAAFADVDGDGHPDLIAGNYFPDGAQVLDPGGTSAAMQMQDSMSRAENGGRNRLLLWSNGRYRDASQVFPPEIAHAWTLAIGAQDLDGDLLPEIYFANDFGRDRLLRNRSRPGHPAFALIEGKRHFTDPRSKILGRDSFKGMGVDFTDLNRDGVPDIFVSNITDDYALEESNLVFVSESDGYRDRSEQLGLSRGGWAWDARFADFDNDATAEVVQATGFVRGSKNRWPELHELAMGNDTLLHRAQAWPHFGPGTDLSGDNHNPFFVRAEDGRYHDLAGSLGMAEPSVSRGIAVADVDADGRLDYATGNQWQDSKFFANTAPRAANFLLLDLRLANDLEGIRAVRGAMQRATGVAAIGATVRVQTADGASWIGQVDGGNGHSGKRSYQLHAGLGQAKAASVQIRWRDRSGRVSTEHLRLASGAWTILLGEVRQ